MIYTISQELHSEAEFNNVHIWSKQDMLEQLKISFGPTVDVSHAVGYNLPFGKATITVTAINEAETDQILTLLRELYTIHERGSVTAERLDAIAEVLLGRDYRKLLFF